MACCRWEPACFDWEPPARCRRDPLSCCCNCACEPRCCESLPPCAGAGCCDGCGSGCLEDWPGGPDHGGAPSAPQPRMLLVARCEVDACTGQCGSPGMPQPSAFSHGIDRPLPARSASFFLGIDCLSLGQSASARSTKILKWRPGGAVPQWDGPRPDYLGKTMFTSVVVDERQIARAAYLARRPAGCPPPVGAAAWHGLLQPVVGGARHGTPDQGAAIAPCLIMHVVTIISRFWALNNWMK